MSDRAKTRDAAGKVDLAQVNAPRPPMQPVRFGSFR
jgi:hypothetical protein